MKKLVSALLTFVFAFSFSVCAFATDASSGDNEQYILSTGIYEGEALEACAEMLGYEMVTDDGYSLQSISVSYEENNDQNVVTKEPSVTPYALGDYIGDVKKVASDCYFPDDPIASNWYDGPLTKNIDCDCFSSLLRKMNLYCDRYPYCLSSPDINFPICTKPGGYIPERMHTVGFLSSLFLLTNVAKGVFHQHPHPSLLFGRQT